MKDKTKTSIGECSECDAVYVGETSRQLNTKVNNYNALKMIRNPRKTDW